MLSRTKSKAFIPCRIKGVITERFKLGTDGCDVGWGEAGRKIQVNSIPILLLFNYSMLDNLSA